MAEEDVKDSSVKSTIEAVTGLVNAVPIYQDALQPTAKQIGQSLETVAKAVNIALVPLRGIVWGYEQIEKWVKTRVVQKLENTPEENIITPPLQIAGPIIEALRYSSDDAELQELYANLLASSMNTETAHKAHPGYVQIIRNITKDEAIILKIFADKNTYPLINLFTQNSDENNSGTLIFRNYTHFHKSYNLSRPDLMPSYIDNLCRLGLIEIPATVWLSNQDYGALEKDKDHNEMKNSLSILGRTISFERRLVRTTAYGDLFIENVVVGLEH